MIAENGAVLHFPHGGHTSLLASRIPEAYLAELGLRGVPFRAGQCLVDADAAEGQRLLDVIRALELPLVLMFNRGRVMTLPQGVSKATGLHAALETLRVSTHNTLAIGEYTTTTTTHPTRSSRPSRGWSSSGRRRPCR